MRKLFICLIMCVGLISAKAQSVGDMFASLPYDKAEYLTKELRAELVSNYNTGKEAKVVNKLQGETHVDTLSTDFGRFLLSESKSLTLARLPYADGDSIYLCIETFSAPAMHSVVEFFDHDWKKYPTMRFISGIDSDSLTMRPDTMSVETYDSLKSLLSPKLISYDYDPMTMTLDLNVTAPFLSNDEMSRIDAILCKRRLKWMSVMFK